MFFRKVSVVVVRVIAGWYFLYAGFTKVADPAWSAAGYLTHAGTFADFFAWLAQPGIIEVVDFLNQWGLLLVGIALIAGVFTRFAALSGALLLLLYYLPNLSFPYAGEHGYIVDYHLFEAAALVLLASLPERHVASIDRTLARSRALPLFLKKLQ